MVKKIQKHYLIIMKINLINNSLSKLIINLSEENKEKKN